MSDNIHIFILFYLWNQAKFAKINLKFSSILFSSNENTCSERIYLDLVRLSEVDFSNINLFGLNKFR